MKKLILVIFLLIGTLTQAGDDKFRIIYIGEDYKPNEEARYLKDVANSINELNIAPTLRQRWGQFDIRTLGHKNQFNCTESTNWDGSSCKWANVNGAVGNIPRDLIIVLSAKLKGGGASRGGIMVVGTAASNRNVTRHEAGHEFGLADHTGGVMSVLGDAYIAFQQDTINAVLDRKAGLFIDTVIPTLNPLAVVGITTFKISTRTSPDVSIVQLWVNYVKVQEEVYWERNIYHNDSAGINFFRNFPSGTNQVIVKVWDAKKNATSQQTLITAP